MSSRTDRFRQRQTLIQNKQPLTLLPTAIHADELTRRPINNDYVRRVMQVNAVPVVAKASDAEIAELLNSITSVMTQDRLAKAISDGKRDTLVSIAGPFYLGKLVSAYDRTGGDVNTIFNVRKGLYATKEAHDAYEARGGYNYDAYHDRHPNYKAEGNTDAYSGQEFAPSAGRQSLNPSIEHYIPTSRIHNDAGRVLAGVNGPDLANEATNLGLVIGVVNSSKGDKSATEFTLRHFKPKNVERRQRKLAKLKALENPTPQQLHRIKLLDAHESVVPEHVQKMDAQARKPYEEKLEKAYYGGTKFKMDTLKAGASSGVKMGLQQSFGMMLVEFLAGMYDEITDWYKNGRVEASVFRELKRRLNRLAKRLVAKWKEALSGFGSGFIAGFLSNIVTTVINTFITTAKRVGRMLREGCMALLQAVKLLLLRPDGMDSKQAADAASKVMLGGAIVVGGVLLEEIIEKQFLATPFLMPIASIAVPVIVGSLTALMTTFAVYLLDRADPFGVNAHAQNIKIAEQLSGKTEATIANLKAILD